jgi:NAD(P)-dependent dehydrogenase (short-subunit alcohol dehydrogenase family)
MGELLKDQVVIITGGAGAIGRAISNRFIDEGAILCLCDIDAPRLNEVTARLTAEHGAERVMSEELDVRKPKQVSRFVNNVVEKFGRIDVLINNAAVTVIVRIDETTDEQIDEILDTNLKGYFYFARSVAGPMKQAGHGNMLLVSSKNGLEGASEKSLYSSAKAAELGMARSLARELGEYGIRVNSICPDAVHEGSKLWERGGPYSVATAKRYSITEDQIPDYYRNRCSLKINIQPDDVANAALFLCSDQSRATTGSILSVDGGVAYVR